jgi:hypothetical protein
MVRIARSPSPLEPGLMLLVVLLVAATCLVSPADDPKSKSKSKGSGESKAEGPKSKGSEARKGDESKSKSPDEKKAEEAAKRKDDAFKVAESYLVLLDKGKYAESWEAMTAEVRKGITRRKWVDALGKTRSPFGKLRSRKLNRIEMRATEVAERFDEAWVYTDLRTVEGVASSELVIVILQDGKDWTVSSYYIGDPGTFPKPQPEDKETKPPEK